MATKTKTAPRSQDFVRVGSAWTSEKTKGALTVKVNEYTFFINPNQYKVVGKKSPDFFVSTFKDQATKLELMDSKEYYLANREVDDASKAKSTKEDRNAELVGDEA